MLRFLLIVLVIAMVMAWLNRLRAGGKIVRDESEKLLPAEMVQCHHCQLHLIREEAVASGGHYYCCAEHQKMAETESRR